MSRQYHRGNIPNDLDPKLRELLRMRERFLRSLSPRREPGDPGSGSGSGGSEPPAKPLNKGTIIRDGEMQLLSNVPTSLAQAPVGTRQYLRFTHTTEIPETDDLKLNVSFTPKNQDSVLGLVCDGYRWWEMSRRGGTQFLDCPVVINEDGDACQPVLRVETANNANAIYVDGLNDYVGIGTNAPGALLDVRGDAVFNEDGGDFDFRIEGDTVPFMFNVDASRDVLSIGEIAQAGGTATGGRVQILGSPTGAAIFSDQANKMLWIKYNAQISGGSDSGVHRGIFLDYDHDYAAGALNVMTYTSKPFELDIDYTRSTIPAFASTTIAPFTVTIDLDANLDAGRAGSPDSPLQFVVNHNTSTAANVPGNGYITYSVSCNGASAIAQSVFGVQYVVTGKNTGATNSLTALQANLTGATGITANMRGIARTVTPKSTANRVRVFEATLGAGTPAADLVMAFFGTDHIMSNSSIIAAGGATPNATSPTHLSFTDGTSNLYAEDNLEVDGTAYLDGNLDHNGTNVGFYSTTPVAQASALTTKLTTITHTGPATPDYAIATPVDSSVGANWGFSTQDEFETVMSVIRNLQIRQLELEQALDSSSGVGLIV